MAALSGRAGGHRDQRCDRCAAGGPALAGLVALTEAEIAEAEIAELKSLATR
jgi:hypothetical protein